MTQNITAQRVGIGVENPKEKLEVDGIVYSNFGGFRFPDSTLQTSAANARSLADASQDRSFIIMEIQINGAGIVGPYSDDNFIDAFEVIDWEMNLERDLSTGYGDLIKVPFSLVKNMDEKSVDFANGLIQSSTCDVILHLMTANTLEEYLTIYLTNARISQIKEFMAYKGNGKFAQLERIFFWPNTVILEDPISGETSTISFN